MKVQCFPKKSSRSGYIPPGHAEIELKKTAPFFKSGQGGYTHRIRSGKNYYRNENYSHTGLTLWCGMTGLIGKTHKNSKLLLEPSLDSIMCATCEGRAIGSGQLGSHEILGRLVKFQPRGF